MVRSGQQVFENGQNCSKIGLYWLTMVGKKRKNNVMKLVENECKTVKTG
jgi:hypothetical protein